MIDNNNKNHSRKCIVTNQIKPITELIRFDYNKNTGLISLDLNKSLKGRGAYFIPTVENWERIKIRKGLNKVFKFNVTKQTYEQIEKELKEAECLKKIE